MSNKNFDNQILKNMSDKKQTAIEWLINEWPILKSNLPIWLIEQAKEMENKRMMQCYSDGLGNGIAVGREECSFESVADEKEYLIKTYGGNK
jgi:hypothetical protein